MKALIRDTEIYAETAWSPFTRNHLLWTHTARPDGDGYALAEECPEDAQPSDFDITSVEVSTDEEYETEGGAIAVRTVTKLIATLNQERYDAHRGNE